MKHHVLLGLILGLLATARLGGQVLFNVELNPSANTVKITATGQNPAPLALVDTFASNVDLNDGITFINFFTNTAPTVPNTINTQLGDSFPAGLKVYKLGTDGVTLSEAVLFDRFIISDPGLSATSGLNPGFSNVENPLNPGKSLNIFVQGDQRDPFDLRFSSGADISLPSVTVQFPQNVTLAASEGPYFVYAGQRSVHYGSYREIDEVTQQETGPDIFYTSFLGTYTITVVPEPSTYAAIAGGLGLVVAVLHRRRQRSRASAA